MIRVQIDLLPAEKGLQRSVVDFISGPRTWADGEADGFEEVSSPITKQQRRTASIMEMRDRRSLPASWKR